MVEKTQGSLTVVIVAVLLGAIWARDTYFNVRETVRAGTASVTTSETPPKAQAKGRAPAANIMHPVSLAAPVKFFITVPIEKLKAQQNKAYSHCAWIHKVGDDVESLRSIASTYGHESEWQRLVALNKLPQGTRQVKRGAQLCVDFHDQG